MNLSGNKSRLMGVTKELSLRWEETRNYWRDAKSQEFDKKYMQELVARVDKAVTIIEKLDEVLKKVQSDCE
jgi:predicted outer membrane protein